MSSTVTLRSRNCQWPGVKLGHQLQTGLPTGTALLLMSLLPPPFPSVVGASPPWQVLRVLVYLSSHALLLPLLNSVAQVYSCRATRPTAGPESWLSTGITCYSSTHIIVLVAASALLLTFSIAAIGGGFPQTQTWSFQVGCNLGADVPISTSMSRACFLTFVSSQRRSH